MARGPESTTYTHICQWCIQQAIIISTYICPNKTIYTRMNTASPPTYMYSDFFMIKTTLHDSLDRELLH